MVILAMVPPFTAILLSAAELAFTMPTIVLYAMVVVLSAGWLVVVAGWIAAAQRGVHGQLGHVDDTCG